jgi:hypothetical protein
MHANSIDGGTRETRADFVREKSAGLTNLIHVEAEKTSITIKQIQELVASLSSQSPVPRVVWIEEANLMTPPAQNALLKSLEEPPHNTTFYLTCDHATALLPTIASRAQTTHLDTQASIAAPHLPLIKEAMGVTLGNRLQLVSQIPSDRTEALAWLDELSRELAATLRKTTARPAQLLLVNIAKNTATTHTRLKANCSVGLTLQNFLLHLPKTK